MIGNYIVGVAMILEKDNKILIGKRSEHKDFGGGLWELPSGRLDQGEGPEEAITREGHEELNVAISARKIIDAYQFKRNKKDMILLTYICNYKGNIKRSEEHSEIKWVKPHEAKELFFFTRQKKTIDKFLHSR